MTFSCNLSVFSDDVTLGYNQTKMLPPSSVCFSINLSMFDSSIFDGVQLCRHGDNDINC